MLLLIVAASMAAAEDAPAMWMVQTDNDIDLWVNTSTNVSGVSVCVHYDPDELDITNMSFEGSPWQPLTGTGWSHSDSGYVSLALTNFDGVAPGEYKVATMDVDCPEEGVFAVWLEYADLGPDGVTVYDLNYTNIGDKGDAVISIGDGTGTMTLPIIISDAANVGAVDVTLNYDPTVVTVTGVADGAMDCTYTNTEHVDEGWIRVGAIQGDNPGLDGEFILLNINFSAVAGGATCPLNLTVTTFKDATPNCTSMTYTVINGVYVSSQNGDVNGDDEVDIADAMYIAKHVIGIEGYGIIDEWAADVNGDGSVDMSDSMYLTKHVLGMIGFEELR